MKSIALVLFALCAASCSKSSDRPDLSDLPPGLQKMGKGIDKAQANEKLLTAELAKDTTPVVELAKKDMSEAVTENFGDDALKKATITTGEVKTFGPKKWEVHGHYSGPDKNDKHLERDWVAEIQVAFGGLQCMSVKMKDDR